MADAGEDRNPLPIPAGVTQQKIEAMLVTDGNWRPAKGFVCLKCDGPAMKNPYTDQIWGCGQCGRTTHLPDVFFVPASTEVPAATPA